MIVKNRRRVDFYTRVVATTPVKRYGERSFPSMRTASFRSFFTSGRRNRVEVAVAICLNSLIASQQEEVSWTTFELAVYMQFAFVTAISISTLETQGKLTQYQHHRKKNNENILHPVDLDLEKQHGKVIQRIAGAKNKLLEKGMKTPSSLVINLLTSIHKSNCLLLQENTQRRLSVKSLTTEIISSFPCISQPRSLHLVHLHKPESFFLSSLGCWVSGFKWNLLHNLFHIDNGMQYIHVHFVLFALCWNWFLVSK